MFLKHNYGLTPCRGRSDSMKTDRDMHPPGIVRTPLLAWTTTFSQSKQYIISVFRRYFSVHEVKVFATRALGGKNCVFSGLLFVFLASREELRVNAPPQRMTGPQAKRRHGGVRP